MERARSHEHLLWMLVAGQGLHMLEEHAFNLAGWANAIGFHCTPTDLHLLNGTLLFFGVCAAAIGWRSPVVSLAFPAHLLVNVLFHAGASFVRGPNPGVFSAVLLLLPLSIACFIGASRDGILSGRRIAAACVFGGVVHAYPFVLLVARPVLRYAAG